MNDQDLLQWPCGPLLQKYPFIQDFFSACGLSPASPQQTVEDLLADPDPKQMASLGFDQRQLVKRFSDFVEQMVKLRHNDIVRTLTIKCGHDKDGRPENIDLEFNIGEISCVVGPTGAGKSMLLSDIECLAQGDTPSGRYILINHQTPDEAKRLSGNHRLVAQLSQNMNFVMDLSVKEFLVLHAQSRLVENVKDAVGHVFDTAVGLTGEAFGLDTPITALSGGQSRALMIADVACLSASPIVLIDEIENAGVDRRKALNLLMQEKKIVIMATHDPLLALSGQQRLVVRNGGIAAIIKNGAEENAVLKRLEDLDRRLSGLRNRIRRGERLGNLL